MSYVPRLKKEYNDVITKNLMDNHSLGNIMQVQNLKKLLLVKVLVQQLQTKKL